MNRHKTERALIGFLVGGAMGLGVGFLLLWVYNMISTWIGPIAVEIDWWAVLPFAFVIALSMAINMANPPFAD